MAAVKRTLFRFRFGDEEEDDNEFEDVPMTIDGAGGTDRFGDDADDTDDGPGLPYAWVGIAVGSLAGLGVAAFKLYKHRQAAKAAKKEEPWKVEEKTSRLPDDPGTASLVGLGFVAAVNALGKRLERFEREE